MSAKPSRLMLSACLIALVCAAGVASSQDWPQWRGPKRDGIAPANGLATRWGSDGPPRLWRVPVGLGYSSPIAVDGVVYAFGQDDKDHRLTALSAADGNTLWTQAYPAAWSDRSYPGTRATPAIAGERIYTFGGGGELTCRRISDGKLIWQVNVLELTGSKPIHWGCASSPLVVNGTVYVQAGAGNATAVALDAADGSVVWKSQYDGPAGYATIAQANVDGTDMLLVFAGTDLVAMDPADGRTLWTLGYETDYRINAATPIVRDDLVFITHAYRRSIGTMLRIRPDGVETVWENGHIASKFVTPILDGDELYANSNGTLVAVAWDDGSLLWRCEDKALQLAEGGSVLRAGDMLITLSANGELSLAHATPESVELRGQVDLFERNTNWATPLLYEGKLYVKGNTDLICLDATAKP